MNIVYSESISSIQDDGETKPRKQTKPQEHKK